MKPTENEPRQLPPSAALLQMMSGFWVSAAIYAVAKLGLADYLADGPVSVDDLAQKVDSHPGALYRLLRALASAGLFTEVESRRFALTPLGECLRTGVPGSLRSYAITAKEMGWEPWGQLLHSIKTGGTAFEHVHGMGYFDYLKERPELAGLFNEAMTGFVTMNGFAVAEAYDFTLMSKIVDVGGGHGALTSAILKKYPKMSSIIFDLPDVVEGTGKKLRAAGVSDRCECVGGDFFKDVPSGGDVYLMASIIHDWDDDRAIAILKNCRRAMSDSAKLLLVEMVIPPGDVPFFGKLLDLMMLVNFGGRERTEAEYKDLLAAAGLRLTKIMPTRTPSSLIEAVPV
jgi:hypothetical protein